MTKILAIIDKEWHEALRNRMVLFTSILLPLIFTVLPLTMLAITHNLDPEDAESEETPFPAFDNPAFDNLTTDLELMQGFLANQMLVLFLLVPLAIPMTIASYSVVGEKREKSLEPLLATPITVAQLLLGKAVAAALPGVAAAWISFSLYAAIAPAFVVSEAVYGVIFNATSLLAVFLVAPLLTVLAVSVGLMVSSRVNDPRAAEQLGMLIVLPVLGLMFGQLAGLVYLGPPLMLGLAAGLVVIDAGLVFLGTKLFERERILTRWK